MAEEFNPESLENTIRDIYNNNELAYNDNDHNRHRDLYTLFNMEPFRGKIKTFNYEANRIDKNTTIYKIGRFSVCKITGGGKQMNKGYRLPVDTIPSEMIDKIKNMRNILSNIQVYSKLNDSQKKDIFKYSYLYAFIMKFCKNYVFKYYNKNKVFISTIPQLKKKNPVVPPATNINALPKLNIYNSVLIKIKEVLIETLLEKISSIEMIMDLGAVYNNLFVLNQYVESNKEELNYIPFLLSFIKNRLFYLLYIVFSINHTNIMNSSLSLSSIYNLQLNTNINNIFKKMKKMYNYNAGNQIFNSHKDRRHLKNISISDDTYNIINKTQGFNNAHYDTIYEKMQPLTLYLLEKYNYLDLPIKKA